MITAVDTNVLIDIFRNDPEFGARSAEALRRSIQEGQIVACDIVWAELAAVFPSRKACNDAMGILPIEFVPLNKDAAVLAGEIWRKYRAQGGTRARVVADFLIASHAMVQCDRLLSRDRGFYRRHFKKLHVLDPAGGPKA